MMTKEACDHLLAALKEACTLLEVILESHPEYHNTVDVYANCRDAIAKAEAPE